MVPVQAQNRLLQNLLVERFATLLHLKAKSK
jgi:hypothetical protein